MAETITLLQVSDMHLQQEPDMLLKGVNVEQRFQQVLAEIESQSADALLLTGDLTHHAPRAYDRLVSNVHSLPYPTYWIPGNHDLPEEMARFTGTELASRVKTFDGWKLIFLDSSSHPDGKGSGSLSESELSFLKAELSQTAPDQHALLVLHHHPVSVKSRWQDEICLGNADQFWQIVELYPQVKGVIFGHVHQSWALQRGDIQLFSVPATAAQFKAQTDSSEVEDDPKLAGPAYGRYQLYSCGKINQQVIRLPA
ncbi:metallophosphoesterase [Neptuniibacter sp. PT8_73]|uniref:metallophosphoesterase n=1 Tax=unclassified Neptuniibacter TaxID=2630693 RepID=UPI0039F65188